ncbi:MAG: ParB/RepB/Spo0J family partition protein [Prosthecobacter sp.]|nr:ParB/RepB/Spo0J family partition protein [Prosthecobacter sp.]
MKLDLNKPWTGRVAVESVCRNPEQPRVHFDTSSLDKLGASMKRRQQAPCPVVPFTDAKRPEVQWMLIDGERRWRAAGRVKLKTLWVCYEPGVDAGNLHESSLAANFNREGHTKMDTARALHREIEAGKTCDDLAEVVGKSTSWVAMYLGLMKLHPLLQELLDAPTPAERRIPLKIAAALSNYPQARQQALYQRCCEGKREGEALNMLRVKAGAPMARKNDDVRYVLGRIRAAWTMVKELNVLGEKVLQAMPAERAGEGLVMLEQIRAEVVPLKQRLEKIAG